MRRVLTAAVSVVTMAVLTVASQGCLLGRSLYYVDEPVEQDLNPTVGDAGVTGSDAGEKGAPSSDGGTGTDPMDPMKPASDAGVKDAGPGPGPGPEVKPTCAGGTANEREGNDTIATANLLAIGKTCGALAVGDTDWFTIDFGEKGEMNIRFEASGNARMLSQSAGGGISFATGPGGDLKFTTSGKWNMRVVSDTGSAQPYALIRQ